MATTQITLWFIFITITFHRAQGINTTSLIIIPIKGKKTSCVSIFLNEIRIWITWLGKFLSPNLHMVWGHNFVLGNVIHNEEIPTSISIQRSQSNNNMKVSSPTGTSVGKHLLSIMLSICFVPFSFRLCRFQQDRSSVGSCFELFSSWNTSGVFIGILEKLFIMLHMAGSWPIFAFAAVTPEHRTWVKGWKGKENISRNDNSERHDMKYWILLWAAFFQAWTSYSCWFSGCWG